MVLTTIRVDNQRLFAFVAFLARDRPPEKYPTGRMLEARCRASARDDIVFPRDPVRPTP